MSEATVRWWLRGCVVAIAGATVLALLASLQAQEKKTVGSPWRGREVFQEKGCIQCHSVFGTGGKGGPDLGKEKFFGTHLELAALMWNHFPRMRKAMIKKGYRFEQLDQGEMADLLSYLSFIRCVGEPGNILRGKRLLSSKGCIKCHKFGGVGGDVGPDITASKDYMSPIVLVESMWNHGPALLKAFEERGMKMPEFKDNEIVDLAAAIRSYMTPKRLPVGSLNLGDPERGRQLMQEKGCMHCHSYRGAGGTEGPDFADMKLEFSVTQFAGLMWNHGPKMWRMMKEKGMEFPEFKPGEMADVIAYIYELKFEDAPGDATRGRQVLESRGCLSCHSLQGRGGEKAPDLATIPAMESPLAMIAAMWNHAPAMQEKAEATALKWPELNSRDMADLYAFLRSLTPAGPAEQ